MVAAEYWWGRNTNTGNVSLENAYTSRLRILAAAFILFQGAPSTHFQKIYSKSRGRYAWIFPDIYMIIKVSFFTLNQKYKIHPLIVFV